MKLSHEEVVGKSVGYSVTHTFWLGVVFIGELGDLDGVV